MSRRGDVVDSFVEGFLAGSPCETRDQVAIELIGAAAAHLVMLVGPREAAEAVYRVADEAAGSPKAACGHG